MSYKSELTLLVSGFGPFDHFQKNPSADIALSMDGADEFGVVVKSTVIDVHWQQGWQQLKETIELVRPDALLSLGLAEESVFRLETVARNSTITYRDIEHNYPDPKLLNRIDPNGSFTYNSTLPVDWLLQKFQSNLTVDGQQGEEKKDSFSKIRISQDAGAYLCNYVFYQALHHFRETIPCIGFVHVPALSQFEHLISDDEILSYGQLLIKLLMGWMRYAEIGGGLHSQIIKEV